MVDPALLPRAPWVDAPAVVRIGAQFRQFVDHSVAQGYNAVVVPGFQEYVTGATLTAAGLLVSIGRRRPTA